MNPENNQEDSFAKFRPIQEEDPEEDEFAKFRPKTEGSADVPPADVKPPEDKRSFLEKQKAGRTNLIQDTGLKIQEAMGGMPEWYEPDFSEQNERWFEMGMGEAHRGMVSGATFGASEYIPGLETQDNFASTAGKGIGALPWIAKGARNIQQLGKPILNAAAKSPILRKQVVALAELTSVGILGTAYSGATQTVSGKMIDPVEALIHGAEWVALDGALRLGGSFARWGKGIYDRMTKSGKPAWEEVNNVVQQLKKQGVDFTKPEQVNAKAMEILDKPAETPSGRSQTRSVEEINNPDEFLDRDSTQRAQDLYQGETRPPSKSSGPQGGMDFSNNDPTATNVAARQLAGETLKNQPQESNKQIKLSAPRQKTKAELEAEKVFDQQYQQKRTDLKDKKIKTDFFDKLDNVELAKPIPPEKFEALQLAAEAENAEIEQSLEQFGKRPESNQELGKNIQADLEAGLNAAKNEYRPAFNLAEEAAERLNDRAPEFSRTALPQLRELTSLETRPAGYDKVIADLETAFEDAGYRLITDPQGRYTDLAELPEKQVSQLIKLNKRLKEIINFESLDKHVTDLLKPASAALERDIERALRKDSDALEMYQSAKKLFAETSEKYGRDSIKQMRRTEFTEKLAKMTQSPTALQDLRSTVSPRQYQQIERELLEQMKNMKADRANAFHREIRQHLTPEADLVATEILVNKLPKESPLRRDILRDKIRETIYDDLTKSSLTGERPDKVLKYWQTKEGQQLIKDELKNNPNKQEVLDYLADQSLNDVVETVVQPDGEINFDKLNEILKDPVLAENIKLTGGQEAVNFVKQLETLSKRIQKNKNVMDQLVPPGFERDVKGKLKAVDKKNGDILLRHIAENEKKLGTEEKLFSEINPKKLTKEQQAELKYREAKGEAKLEKTKERNKDLNKQFNTQLEIQEGSPGSRYDQISRDVLGEEAGEAAKKNKPAAQVRGEQRLDKMKRKDQKLNFKVDDFFKSLGYKPNAFFTMLGLTTHVTTGGASYVAYRAFRRMLRSPKIRKNLHQLSKSKIGLEEFLNAFENIGNEL